MSDNSNVNSSRGKSKLIVVIGNGFDLDMELPTRYSDFVNDDYYFKSVLIDLKVEPSDHEYYIQEKDTNRMNTQRPNQFAQYILEKKPTEKWLDLELLIKQYCKERYAESSICDADIKKDLWTVGFCLNKYMLSNKTHFNQSMLEKLPNYENKVAYRLLKFLIESQTDYVIWDFNYSYTVTTLMEKLGCDSKYIETHHRHMHGSTHESQKVDDVRIVLGCDMDVEVFKCCPSAIKCNDSHYKINYDLWKHDVQSTDTMIVMGHGLGETDSQYFSLLKDSMIRSILIMMYDNKAAQKAMTRLCDYYGSQFSQLLIQNELKIQTFASKHEYYEYVPGFGQCVYPDKIQNLQKVIEDCINYCS